MVKKNPLTLIGNFSRLTGRCFAPRTMCRDPWKFLNLKKILLGEKKPEEEYPHSGVGNESHVW